MKKFYALAAAALVAVAANAQNGAPLYATGAGGFVGGEWAPATPDEFVYADGVYTLEVANLTQIKISTTCNPDAGEKAWDAFNAGAYDCGENGYGDTPGVAVALVANADPQNIACPWKGDYTVTVAGDLSTITLSTKTPKPTGPAEVYFRGTMNNWLNDGVEDAWKLERLGNEVFKFVCADDQLIGVGETFKLADADWNAYNLGGNGEVLLLDLPTAAYNGGDPANFSFGEDWNGVCYVHINGNESNIFFSNDKDAENPYEEFIGSGVEGVALENNAAAAYYTLQGVRVANPENGLFIVVKDGKASKVLVK